MKRFKRIQRQLGPDGLAPKTGAGPYGSEWEYIEEELALLNAMGEGKAEAAKAERTMRARLKATEAEGEAPEGARPAERGAERA